jgi:hypothetical protein
MALIPHAGINNASQGYLQEPMRANSKFTRVLNSWAQVVAGSAPGQLLNVGSPPRTAAVLPLGQHHGVRGFQFGLAA